MRAEEGTGTLTGTRRRTRLALAIVALAALLSPMTASADGIFTMYGGAFLPRGFESRDVDDVLLNNSGFLAFEMEDFNGFQFGGEYHVGIGKYLEAGAGAGYYSQSTTSVYLDYVNFDGREIPQDLKLRIVPVTFTARVFPFGRDAAVQPYVGGGVALLNWQYSEVGEFVDFNNDGEIFRDRFVDDGNVVAPVMLGGIRFPVSDAFLLGGEFRYQGGKADLDPDLGFAGSRLDLSGYSWLATVQIRF